MIRFNVDSVSAISSILKPFYAIWVSVIVYDFVISD